MADAAGAVGLSGRREMAERGQFACDDSETAAPMHALYAGEFPGPYTVRKNYLARHDGAT